MKNALFFYLISPIFSQCINNICTTNMLPENLNGLDSVNIQWNPSMFNTNNVFITLVTQTNQNTESNCFFGYSSLMIQSTDTAVLDTNINNLGTYIWNIPNYNYDNLILYYIIIKPYAILRCNLDTSQIEDNYYISNGFYLHPKFNTGFTWFWPPNSDKILTINLGQTYNIIAQGYDHIDRIGYSLKLYASINNFDESSQWGTWKQVDMHDINHNNVNIFETPNWLNWGD